MRLLTLILISAFLFPFTINGFAQDATIKEKIQQVENGLVPSMQTEGPTSYNINERMAFYHIKGISIAVVHNYKIEWAKGYGWANEEKKLAVTTATLFQAGSVSKSLNSIGVLKLVQQKKIDLYADINTYLKSWKFPYDSLSKGKKITVANLLSHTAGLTVHGFGGYQIGKQLPTIPQILDGMKPANSPAVRSMYQPGYKYEYSGGGTIISQLIVMDVTGQQYDKYMFDNVLKPMGMTNSSYQQPPAGKEPQILSTAYYPNDEVIGKYHVYPEQAAAGLWTNPTDLAKYVIETQLALQGKSHKVLDQETTKIRLTPYVDKSAALGVFIDNLDGTKYFQHSGVDEGFITQYYGSLEDGNGLVVMINTSNGNSIMPEIINSIAKVYGFKGLYRSKLYKIMPLTDDVLQTYTGQYELDPGFILTVFREGHRIFGQATGQSRIEIFPEGGNKFFAKEPNIEVEFVKNDKGDVVRLLLNQGGTHGAKKIK
ncbi:MAG: serine hydrolase [Mucilaginibacter sp.]|nr:serine hydrolase [Mucilaginibacter sp.]